MTPQHIIELYERFCETHQEGVVRQNSNEDLLLMVIDHRKVNLPFSNMRLKRHICKTRPFTKTVYPNK